MHQAVVESVSGKSYGRIGVPGTISNTGRPTLYCDSVVDEIIARLSAGETLTAACRHAGMPAARTVWEWMNRMPEFAKAVAHAREAGADALVTEGLDRLDNASVGPMGSLSRQREVAAHQRWMAARMDPSRWGDKMQVQHSGVVQVEALEPPAWLGSVLELDSSEVEDDVTETGSEGAQGASADGEDDAAHSTVGDGADLFEV